MRNKTLKNEMMSLPDDSIRAAQKIIHGIAKISTKKEIELPIGLIPSKEHLSGKDVLKNTTSGLADIVGPVAIGIGVTCGAIASIPAGNYAIVTVPIGLISGFTSAYAISASLTVGVAVAAGSVMGAGRCIKHLFKSKKDQAKLEEQVYSSTFDGPN